MRLPRTLILASLSACVGATPEPEPTPEPPEQHETKAEAPANLGPYVPPDIPQANPTQADAVAYAWQQFVGLNWPAVEGQRGVADVTKMIGAPAGAVVWETWKDPSEVFLPDGSTPVPWNQYGGTVPPICAGATSKDMVITRISKSPDDSDNPVFSSMDEAVGGTLTDQRGNLTRYEIRMNEVIFDDIVEYGLYNTQGQAAAGPINFDWTAMETKASWRQFTAADTEQIRSRYYRRSAWVYTPPLGTSPATCVQMELGLVGLHIIQKTVSRPQWTWATFEQVDNVPPFGTENQPAAGLIWAYNNPSCPVQDCPPNKSTEKDGLPTGVPTQVTRQINIGTDAAAANPQWQQSLANAVAGSPWQYYQLIDVQWPQNPAFDPMGDPTPLLLANVTQETYVPESSCLACHYTANTATTPQKPADFTFMLAEAQPATSTGAKP